ncbi:MAG: sortase [Patescibacteria group bacterium]
MDATFKRRLKLVLPILLVLGIFAAFNADYLRIHIAYAINGPASVATPELTLHVPGAQSPTSTPNTLTIPSLGIQTPIQYVTATNEAAFQEALKNGAVHYPGTAEPGQPGNDYIFGHSSDYSWSGGKYKTVFALLPKIDIGSIIWITDKTGKNFRYKVTETRIVNPKDLSVLDQHENKKKLLTVQTSYPIGTALRRFVVIAELVTE